MHARILHERMLALENVEVGAAHADGADVYGDPAIPRRGQWPIHYVEPTWLDTHNRFHRNLVLMPFPSTR